MTESPLASNALAKVGPAVLDDYPLSPREESSYVFPNNCVVPADARPDAGV